MADINYPIANKQEVDEQLAEKVQGFKLKNEVVNGDFSQGTTGWIVAAGVMSVLNNTIRVTGNGTNTSPNIREDRVITILQNGRKEYARVRMRVRDNQSHSIRMRMYAGLSDTIINAPIQDQWYEVSAIMTGSSYTEATPFIRFHPSAAYVDSATANGKVFELEKPLIIKLTDVFGAGNEPTKEEMDRLVSIVPNQWWDGELDLTQQQYANWLLSFIREKANKQQEAWITPTLLNGWTGNVKYKKDNFGIVHFKGTLTPGTGTAFQLPSQYLPSQTLTFSVPNNGSLLKGAARCVVEIPSRNVWFRDIDATHWFDISGITYFAEV